MHGPLAGDSIEQTPPLLVEAGVLGKRQVLEAAAFDGVSL